MWKALLAGPVAGGSGQVAGPPLVQGPIHRAAGQGGGCQGLAAH